MATSKHTTKEGEGAVDILSNLPDQVIQRILSFLETKQSVQTSILSKGWRNIWISVPDLYFHMDSFKSRPTFEESVDRVMAQRVDNNIQKVSGLRFKYREKKDLREDVSSLVYTVIGYAASHCVNHLFLKNSNYSYAKLDLAALFACQTLKYLKLKGFSLKFCRLATLTTLQLESCCRPFYGIDSSECIDFSVLCPNLVSLQLRSCSWGSNILKISGPKLSNLTMRLVECGEVEISAPELTVFKFFGRRPFNVSVIDLPSLQWAVVGAAMFYKWEEKLEQDKFHDKLFKLLQGLRNAHSVTLSCSTIKALADVADLLEHQPCPFGRLKTLKFVADIHLKIPAKVMMYLLNGSPYAESVLIEFSNGY